MPYRWWQFVRHILVIWKDLITVLFSSVVGSSENPSTTGHRRASDCCSTTKVLLLWHEHRSTWSCSTQFTLHTSKKPRKRSQSDTRVCFSVAMESWMVHTLWLMMKPCNLLVYKVKYSLVTIWSRSISLIFSSKFIRWSAIRITSA